MIYPARDSEQFRRSVIPRAVVQPHPLRAAGLLNAVARFVL